MLHLNQAGYPPQSRKRAFSPHPVPDAFEVVEVSTGRVAFAGTPVGPDHRRGGPSVLDFSTLSTPGRYVVRSGGALSPECTILPDPYQSVYRTAMRSYYALRCGTAIRDPESGVEHAPCHTAPAAPRDGGEPEDVRGGWHDAGDYGRYMPTAAVATGVLLLIPEWAPAAPGAPPASPPVTADQDFYGELHYELAWMLTQQAPDGGVHHKLTSRTFPGMVVPEADTLPQWLYPVHSGSTAQFAAAMARAARLWPDRREAESYAAAAKRAWAWLTAHAPILDIPVDHTGPYLSPTDSDKRLWAASELWRLTREPGYAQYIETHWDEGQWLAPLSWANTSQLALLALAMGSDGPLVRRAQDALRGAALAARRLSDANPYGVALDSAEYEWASAKTALTRGLLCLARHHLDGGTEWLEAGRAQLDWVLGASPLGLSLVAGVGSHAVRHLHHRYSVATGRIVPGLMAGGPNARAQDGVAPKNLGPLSYVDDERAYSVNENAIDYNAPLVVVAALLSHQAARAENPASPRGGSHD